MSSYRYVATVFSMILGLGVTRLLTKVVGLLQTEEKLAPHWVRLVWCAAIFVLQLQFWWGAIELDTVAPHWTLPMFLTTLTVPLLLFLATAMLLPDQLPARDDMRLQFEPVARWGMYALSLYGVMALVLDMTVFHSKGLSLISVVLGVEIVLPLWFTHTKNAAVRAAVAITYLLVVIVASYFLSPRIY